MKDTGIKKLTYNFISNYMSVFLLENMSVIPSIYINLDPTVWLQIDVQRGSIPAECLSRDVD